MGYTVYYSKPEATSAAGFGKVAELPCIFDNRPGYHRLGSRYLIDRGLGVWDPISRGRASRAAPTNQTMRNYAYWLANFLEWAEVRGVDTLTCEYGTHVRGRYQQEMLVGAWSRDGTPLSAQTINLRVQQACDFLSWLSDKGYRASFEIPTKTSATETNRATGSPRHEAAKIAGRRGKVRVNKRRLRMPTDAQLRTWLASVYQRSGETKGLMSETVLLTAMRREEVACLRNDTLPEDPQDWHLSSTDAPRAQQRVLITIKFGTKGRSYGTDHGDKIGPERSIWVPIDLAERLHAYRKKERPKALRKHIAATKDLVEKRRRIDSSVHLFLEESTGQRLSARALYNAWTCADVPFSGWSPHLGRDWWACSVLWREMKKHEHLASLGPGVSAALLESSALSIIRLQIQPQLGHTRDATSLIYLQWAMDMLGENVSIEYDRTLSEE